MGLFSLNVVPDLPLLPVIGKLSGTGLTGFTSTRVPFANATGGLTDNANFTYDSVTGHLGLGTTGCLVTDCIDAASSAGIAFMSYADTMIARFGAGSGQSAIFYDGVTHTGITHCDDKVEFTNTTNYIDEETW